MQIYCLMEMSTNSKVVIWCCRYFRCKFTYNKGEIYDCVVGSDHFPFLSLIPLSQMYHFLNFVLKGQELTYANIKEFRLLISCLIISAVPLRKRIVFSVYKEN